SSPSGAAIAKYALTSSLALRSMTNRARLFVLEKPMSARQSRILVSVIVVPLLFPLCAFAVRHRMGSQLSSNFGQFTTTSNWQIQAPVSSTVNGVSVKTSIVCPPSQGSDGSGSTVVTGPPPASQQICIAGRYLFVYEIPVSPK